MTKRGKKKREWWRELHASAQEASVVGDETLELLTNGGEDVAANQGTVEEEDVDPRQTDCHQAYTHAQPDTNNPIL